MSPYRDVRNKPPRIQPKKRSRKMAGILLATASVYAMAPLATLSLWWVAVCAMLIVIGILVAVVGRSRTPLTRLCALTWHRGDRFGASMLFFGVVAPRYSPRRIEKQKAALEAAQRGMLTYPNRAWTFPFKIK